MYTISNVLILCTCSFVTMSGFVASAELQICEDVEERLYAYFTHMYAWKPIYIFCLHTGFTKELFQG